MRSIIVQFCLVSVVSAAKLSSFGQDARDAAISQLSLQVGDPLQGTARTHSLGGGPSSLGGFPGLTYVFGLLTGFEFGGGAGSCGLRAVDPVSASFRDAYLSIRNLLERTGTERAGFPEPAPWSLVPAAIAIFTACRPSSRRQPS
jgi:hypothetical protein